MVSGGFCELGAAGAEGVFLERGARLDSVEESGGEVRLLDGECGAHELGQDVDVVGVGPCVWDLFELGEQRWCLLRTALGEQHLCGRGEYDRVVLRARRSCERWRAARLLGGESCAPRSANRRSWKARGSVK